MLILVKKICTNLAKTDNFKNKKGCPDFFVGDFKIGLKRAFNFHTALNSSMWGKRVFVRDYSKSPRKKRPHSFLAGKTHKIIGIAFLNRGNYFGVTFN